MYPGAFNPGTGECIVESILVSAPALNYRQIELGYVRCASGTRNGACTNSIFVETYYLNNGIDDYRCYPQGSFQNGDLNVLSLERNAPNSTVFTPYLNLAPITPTWAGFTVGSGQKGYVWLENASATVGCGWGPSNVSIQKLDEDNRRNLANRITRLLLSLRYLKPRRVPNRHCS